MSISAAVAWMCLTFLSGLLWSVADETEHRIPTRAVSIIVALVCAFAFGVFGASKWGVS